MHRISLITIFLLSIVISLRAQSFKKIDTSIRSDLHTITFYDNHGWTVSYGSGELYRSRDNGHTWNQVWKGDSAYFEEVYFFSDKKGYLIGEHGNLLYTNTGGESWSNQLPEDLRNKDLLIYGAYFFDDKNGVVSSQTNSAPATSYNLILRKGRWQALADSTHSFLKIKPFDQKYLLGCTATEIIRFDRNLERTDILYKRSSNAIGILRDIGSRGDFIYALGSRGYFIYSLDGGVTWKELAASATRIRSILFINNRQGFIVGDQGLILETIDGGLSWTKHETDWREDLHRIVQHQQTIWICGKGGLLLTRNISD